MLSTDSIWGVSGRPFSPATFKTKISITDTGGTHTLYADSIYMVEGEVDSSAQPAVLGYANSAGVFVTSNKARFAGLFHLPLQTFTGSDPSALDTFAMRDTVRFYVWDSTANAGQSFDRVIGSGENSVTFQLGGASAVAEVHADVDKQVRERAPKGTTPVGGAPTQFEMLQNYPNPFSGSTRIILEMPYKGIVTIEVLTLSGKQVALLVDHELHQAGSYSLLFNTPAQF